MSMRLEEQIRRYTETMDAMAPTIEELVPLGMAKEMDVAAGESIEITIPLAPSRRRPVPAWVAGIAAAAAVILLSIPIWIWLSADDADVVDTTPTTVLTPPSSIPESSGLDLSQYSLVFDRDSDTLIGTEWEPGEAVVASLDVAGELTTVRGVADDQGGFRLPGFGDCCSDVTVLTVTQGERTETVRIDRGISIDRVDAELDRITLAYGMGLEIRLMVESGDQSNITTVMPESDWWSVDVSGQIDVVPGTRVTALFERGTFAWVVSRTPQTNLDVSIDLNSQVFEGRGFQPDAELGIAVNGVELPGGVVTDSGGHFLIDLGSRGMPAEALDVITLSQPGQTDHLQVRDVSFVRFDAESGLAVGRVPGSGSGSETLSVEIRVRRADGTIREEGASAITISGGVWEAVFESLGPEEAIEDAALAAWDSFMSTVTHLAPVANPYLGLDEPFGNVNGHEFAPNAAVMLRVDGGEWIGIGTTDLLGSFDVNGAVDAGPGDLLEIEVGGTLRSLEIPGLTFDVYDPETRTASGSTDLADGTILSLHVFPTQAPVWETYEVEVSNGEWSFVIPIEFAEGWPSADITWFPEGGGAYSVHFDG